MKSNTEIKLKQNLLATRKPQKDMSRLDEAMIGNCNMGVPEGKIDTKGAVPEVYADAINQRRNREKKIADDFKEQDKAIEDFTKESQKTENKPKGTPEMKKLHLSESLFDESFVVDTKLYKQAEDIADYLEEFMNSGITSNEDYFNDEDREVLSKTLDTLYDFAHAYSTIVDNEDVFEDLKEAADGKLYYKKKRGSLVDIIEDELGRGEVVYKLGASGKYNPTHAPSLNIDQYLIGGGTDEKGEYISAWVPDNKVEDAIAIAKKYGKDYKVKKEKYVKGDNNQIRIYIDESDWDGNYVDPNVPTLDRKA